MVTHDGKRQVVSACCDRAAGAGVCVGMALAQARALFATGDVRIEAADAGADAAALGRLAVWAQRFSPVVAVDGLDGLLLDVTGCARVWGGEDRLVRAAIRDLGRLGFSARAAVAPTFGCAWAVSRFGERDGLVVERKGVRRALGGLPVGALRVDEDVSRQLLDVGVRSIGELLELPRSTLPARFGDELLLRLDRALGQAIETIEPVRPVPPPAVERVFDGPTDRVEAIELTVRELLEEVAVELERRGCGGRRVDVDLTRCDLGPERVTITLGRPSRDAGHLWQLVRPKLERVHLGFGVEAVRVCVAVVGVVRQEQVLCVGDGGNGEDSLGGAGERLCVELFDTLRNRLGEGRVVRAALCESQLPERAFEMVEASDGAARGAGVLASDRPTVLFDRPVPAEVVALTPDGPVHRVSWRGESRVVTACVGPERIAGEWWRAGSARGDRTRDYFAVREERGGWLWLGRGVESGRWFVHGVWA